MFEIFKYAKEINGPWPLLALLFLIICVITLSLLNSKKNSHYKLIRNITIALFTGALLIIVYLFYSFYSNQASDITKKIEGIVYIDKKEAFGVEVNLLQLERTTVTNNFGKFSFTINENHTDSFINMSLKSDNIIDTIIRISYPYKPLEIFLSSIPKKEIKQVKPLNSKKLVKEFSFNIPDYLLNYTSILVNNKEASLSANSTKKNPRIIITESIENIFKISVVLPSNDTCSNNYKLEFSNSNLNSRILFNCK